MITLDQLKVALLDLLWILDAQTTPLILGGGYGLYLKQRRLEDAPSTRTLIEKKEWPEPRATHDLDLFLRPEIVTSATHMQNIRSALESLNYAVISGCEFMQFLNPSGVKIDLLTGPLGDFESQARCKSGDDRRVGPQEKVRLHAHRTDEAIQFDQDVIEIPLKGDLSTGNRYESVICIPQAFSYIMMKLFAFQDRNQDPEKDFARHHALDLYRIIAMLTEDEFALAQRSATEQRSHPKVREAVKIVQQLFAEPTSLGVLRLREHPYFSAAGTLERFLVALKEIVH